MDKTDFIDIIALLSNVGATPKKYLLGTGSYGTVFETISNGNLVLKYIITNDFTTIKDEYKISSVFHNSDIPVVYAEAFCIQEIPTIRKHEIEANFSKSNANKMKKIALKFQNNDYFGIIMMEKIDTTLEDYLKKTVISDKEALKISRMIEDILIRLKHAKLTHGDLHFGNLGVNLTRSGTISEIKLIDFGFSSKRNCPDVDILQILRSLTVLRLGKPQNLKRIRQYLSDSVHIRKYFPDFETYMNDEITQLWKNDKIVKSYYSNF